MNMITLRAIDELSAAWAPLLWKASWQGGVALLLAFAISRWVENIPAHVRCWLWRLAFLKLLIAGMWIIPIEIRCLSSVKSTSPENALVAFEAVQNSIPGQVDAAPRAERHSRPGALSWLMMVWVAGVVIVLANLAMQWAKLRRKVSGLDVLTDERVCSNLAENCSMMGLHRQPELRVIHELCSPFLTGVLRPVIVFPASILTTCSADELKVVLIHELAHIRRRDLIWNWLPALAEAIFFFHPLVWLARREWHLAQETSTDELAVSVFGVSLAAYATSLVELAARCSAATIRPHLSVAASENYFQLSRRLIAMQTFQKLTPRRRLVVVIIVLTIGVLGVVPWKLAARRTQDQPASASSDQKQANEVDAAQDQSTSLARTLTIHVVDSAGQPIKDVRIFQNHCYKLNGVERPKVENKNHLTDSMGKAVLALSGTTDDLRLWATKKNFVPLHALWNKEFQSDGDQIPGEFTFQMQQGTTIGGIVKNENGEPIEGVKIEVEDIAVIRLITATDTMEIKPGNRPVISDWLAEDESAVFTDKHGRWSLGNVSSDKSLEIDYERGDRLFVDDPSYRDLQTRFLFRLSHPEYVDYAKSGSPQLKQDITDESLRDQNATIVMKRVGS